MVTSIQVSERTRQVLDMLKTQQAASSYEIVIERLVSKELKTPASMLGKLPRVLHWTKKDKKGTSHDL